MAFDTPTRNALARLTADARSLLVEEFTRQLQSNYGIQPTGQITKLEKLTHLDDEQRAVAGVLRERIRHLKAGGKNDKKAISDAVDRVIREQSFTVLNRFAALRMCEERGLVQQCTGAGMRSKGFQVYLQTAGSGLGEQYDHYRTFLLCIFDELALDLGVLFDRFSAYGLLFPREPALIELLELLSSKELARIWAEDETIGWIYQYYNDPEERKKMRKESAAPRNSRELAVRNQFFTPRYVVEFLTDNTLGRIWYEMTRGQTRLSQQCRYLVRRPTEIFLAEGEAVPETPDQEGLSQEELLKQPVYIPHRPLKDPREIRLLDPACGSMHFGLYAFDLFETIYEEAWDNGSCPALQEAYESKDEFLKDVPRLIIEHNIHGIDIDPRAVQIAGLSLWLRAQKAWQARGVKPADRPRVRRSNIVCAEPMPGSPEMLEEFVATLNPPLLGELVKTVFDKMQLAGEAGSLLKIEEEIRTAIDTARKEWIKQQGDLFRRKDGGQEEFFDTAEQQVIDALRAYAEQVDADSYQRRLFADDAARGFAFIDLCRKRYDAVVMNPPFGAFSKASKSYAAKAFPNSANDIFAAFIDRFLESLYLNGRLGAITSRTGFFIASFADWRADVICENTQLHCFSDLGGGVMDDATVEAAAYILSPESDGESSSKQSPFVRVLSHADKGPSLEKAINSIRSAENSSATLFWSNFDRFQVLVDSPFVYWVDENTVKVLAEHPPFEPTAADVRKGLRTGDNFRFVRALWEVPITSFTPAIDAGMEPDERKSSGWVPLVLSGSSQPWFSPVMVALNWHENGKELRQYVTKYGSPSRLIQAEDYYFRPGMSWTRRAARFVPYAVPAGCIPTGSRPMAFPIDSMACEALAVSSSRVASAFMRFYGDWFTRPNFLEGKVKLFPWPELEAPLRDELEVFTRREVGERQTSYRGHEPFFDFLVPFGIADSEGKTSVSIDWNTLLGDGLEQKLNEAFGLSADSSRHLCGDLDEALLVRSGVTEEDEAEDDSDDEGGDAVLDCSENSRMEIIVSYGLGTAFGRWDIRYANGERQPPELPDPFDPLPVCPPGMLQNAEGLPAEPKDVPADYPLRISWPGILVDDEGHPEDIVDRVRATIAVIWKDRAEAIEQEACEILGVMKLRDYFAEKKAGGKFFANHLSRYSKSRRQAPIYWPLSTESGSYTLWLYYHRLDDQMLFKCVTDFLEPKIRDVTRDIERLQKILAGGGSADQRDELDGLLDFRIELESMKAELLRVTRLPYKPDLNDGVIINAAPLWKLFRLKKWQKPCKECWEKLEAGDYDWAHMAYHIWPDRVREKCKTDKSLAIAHDLEDLYVEPPKAAKKKRKKRAEPEDEEELIEAEE